LHFDYKLRDGICRKCYFPYEKMEWFKRSEARSERFKKKD
jgi:hypothetical protein